jgi:hypothetical protein
MYMKLTSLLSHACATLFKRDNSVGSNINLLTYWCQHQFITTGFTNNQINRYWYWLKSNYTLSRILNAMWTYFSDTDTILPLKYCFTLYINLQASKQMLCVVCMWISTRIHLISINSDIVTSSPYSWSNRQSLGTLNLYHPVYYTWLLK